MALSAKVVTARVVAASTADVTVTGVGFQPKIAFGWNLGRGDTADASGEGNAGAGTGTDRVFSIVNGTTLASNQRCIGGFTLEGAGAADTSVCNGLGFIVTCTGTATVDGFSYVSAISTDGFTVRTPNALPRTLTMGVLCLGGDDITASSIIDVVEPASTGAVNYAHGLGEAPTAVFGIGCKVTSAATTDGVGSVGSNTITLGLAKSTGAEEQMTWAGQSDEASGTIDSDQYHNVGDFLSMIPDAGGTATNARAQVTALDATNVTLTWVQRAVSDRRYYLLAIAGPRFHASTITVPTTLNGTVSNSGMAAQPRFGLLVHAHNTAENTAGATVGDDSIGIGAWDSATSRHAQAYWDETGNTDTQTNTSIEFDGCLVTTTESAGALDGVLDVSSVASDGVTYITDNNFASGWFAFTFYGMDAAAGATPQAVNATATWTPTLTKVATFPRTISGTGSWAATLSKAATFARALVAAVTGAATLAKSHVVSTTLSAVGTFAATLSNALVYARTLTSAGTWAATLTKAATFARSLPGTGTLAPTLTKVTTFVRTLPGVGTLTATMGRAASLARSMSVSGLFSSTLSKAATYARSVPGMGTFVPTLGKAYTRAQSIVAAATFTGAISLLKSYGRALTASMTGTASLSRAATFARSLAATLTNTATLARIASFARTLAASLTGTPALSRAASFGRTLSGAVSGAVTLAANATRQVAMSAAGLFTAALNASLDLATPITLAATATWTATLSRAATFYRSLTVATSWVSDLVAQAVKIVSMSAAWSAVARIQAFTGWVVVTVAPPWRRARRKRDD